MKVLCIGHASYDISMYSEGFPKENTKYRLKDQNECVGGSALTASLLLGNWGVDTYYSGIIGNDYYGDKVIDSLRKYNVNYDYIIKSDNLETTKSFVIVNKYNASRTIFNSNQNYNETNINYDIEPDIIFSDGEHFDLTMNAYNKYPDSIKVIDADKINEKVTKLCSMSDYIICSKNFAELISKNRIDFDKPDTIKIVINDIEKLYKGKVIVTLENKGCLYKVDDKIKIMSGIKVHAVDTTGAGDIFHGAFIYGLSKGLTLEKCLKIANIAAGLSVKMKGSSSSIPDIMKVHDIYEKNK